MKKIISIIVSISFMLCILIIPSSAIGFVDAPSLAPLQTAYLKAIKDSDATYLMKLDIPDSGRVRFFCERGVSTDYWSLEILDNNGNILNSGTLTDFLNTTKYFPDKGPYYLKAVMLKYDRSVDIGYYYISDHGKKVNKNVNIDYLSNDCYDLRKYVEGFDPEQKWFSSDRKTIHVHSGFIWPDNVGKANVYAYDVKGNCARFIINSGTNAPEYIDWIKDYTLSRSDIDQLTLDLHSYILMENRFQEYKLNEIKAINWIYDGNGNIIDPLSPTQRCQHIEYVKDPLKKFEMNGYIPDVVKIPEQYVDSIIYNMLGIKATHNVEGDYWYYYDGNYYFSEGGVGCMNYIEYISSERLPDGKFQANYKFVRYISERSTSIHNFSVVFSVHKTDDERNYVCLHSVLG